MIVRVGAVPAAMTCCSFTPLGADWGGAVLMLLPLALAATGPWFRLRNLAINFLKDCMTQRYAISDAGMLAAMDRVGGK